MHGKNYYYSSDSDNASSKNEWSEGNLEKNSLDGILFSMDLSSCTRFTPNTRMTRELNSRVQELRT